MRGTDASLSCKIENGEPWWFEAKNAANVFEYKDTDDAIRQHVADDDRCQQGNLNLNPGKRRAYSVTEN